MNDRWAVIAAGMTLCAAFLHTPWANANQAQKSNKPSGIRGYNYAHVETQPATESLDLGMYARIREEGLNHSHIMEYARRCLTISAPG